MNLNFTLIAQAIAFAILIWFTIKFVWPPLLNAIEKRQKEIADGLAAAQEGKLSLEVAAKKNAESLNEVKQKGAEIVSQAEKRASEIVESAKKVAKEEGDRIITMLNLKLIKKLIGQKKILGHKYLLWQLQVPRKF